MTLFYACMMFTALCCLAVLIFWPVISGKL